MQKGFGKLLFLTSCIYLLNPSAAFSDQVLMQGLAPQINKIESLNQQIESDPNAANYLKRADAYRIQGQHKEAVDDINQALHIQPTNTNSILLRSRIYFDEGMYPEAINDCTDALKMDPKIINAYILRSQSFLKLKDYSKAIDDANKLLELSPNSAIAYLLRGAAYDQWHKYTQALTDLNKAIQGDPKQAQAYYYRADANNDLGNYQDAIKDYTQAISLQPGYRAAYLGRAWSNYNLDKTKEAVADCSAGVKFDNAGDLQALEKYSGEKSTESEIEINAEYNLGNQIEEDLKNALTLYDDVLKKKHDDTDALRDRGIVYMHLGKYKEAIRDFEAANKGLPATPQDYSGLGSEADYNAAKPEYLLGNADLSASKFLSAINHYRAALKIYPTYGRCWHNMGIACGDLGDSFTAELCVIHGISYRPDDWKLWNTLGLNLHWEYTRDKTDPTKLANSAAAFKQALLLNPTSDSDKEALRHQLASVKEYERAIAPTINFTVTTMPVN